MISISQPILYSIPAFDARNGNEFKYTYSGNQQFKNRLIVRDNLTNSIVYDKTIETMRLNHNLEGNALTNGKLFNAEIQIIDKDGNVSPFSQKILFYCFASPTLKFTNIEPNQIVANSSLIVNLEYIQSEGELLNSYKVVLYNSSHQEVYSSNLRYDQKLSVTLTGLIDKSQYYIQGSCETVNGMTAQTDLIPISVTYERASIWSMVELTNNRYQGTIRIASNIIAITGRAEPEPPIYIDGSKIDLTSEGSSVTFDEGFIIDNNFTIQISVEKLKKYKEFLIFGDKTPQMKIVYRCGTFNNVGYVGFLELVVNNSFTSYVIQSNYFLPTSSEDIVRIWLRKKNSVYSLIASVESYGTPWYAWDASDLTYQQLDSIDYTWNYFNNNNIFAR